MLIITLACLVYVWCCFKCFFFTLRVYILILTLGHHSLYLKMTREGNFYKALYDSTVVSGNLFAVVWSSVGLIEFLGLCMHGNFAEKKCLLFNSLTCMFLFFHFLGALNFHPDAADSIPGERQPTDINWVNKDRKDSNSNQNRSNLPFPSLSSERGTDYESSSTKHHGFSNPESQYGNSEDFHQYFGPGKSLKNRNLQSQRWHRSRNDSTCTRSKIRQSTVDAAAGPGISDAAVIPGRRAPPRGYNDFLSSESDREVPTADSRGAKPKKTHLMHAFGRGFREKGKQAHDREKRVSSKQKVELFENVPSLDMTQSDSSESSVGKAFCDAPVGSGDEQKGYNYVNKRYPRKPVWNKPPAEKECQKRHDSHRSKNTKVGKKSSLAYTPKDKNERKKELSVHKNDENLTTEIRHQLSDSVRCNGRKFLLKGDQAPALHFSWTQYWKKQSDVPKNKETHTGKLPRLSCTPVLKIQS